MDFSKKLQNLGFCIKVNLRLTSIVPFLSAAAFLCLLPLVQGVSNLDAIQTAICLEQFVSIIGILLFVAIFVPEQSHEIDELVTVKITPQWLIHLIRILLALFSLLVLLAIFIGILQMNHCDFSYGRTLFGTYCTALFLGALGMFFANLCNNSIFGYLVAIGYLLINMMTKNEYVGNFYLFSLSENRVTEKFYLLGGSLVLLVLALTIKGIKRKLHGFHRVNS